MPSSNSPWIGRLKLALIPALAVALLVLVWPARKSEQQASEPAASLPRPQLPKSSAANRPPSGSEADWSAISIDFAGDRNPFAPIETAVKPQPQATTTLATSAHIPPTEPSAGSRPKAVPPKVQAIHEIAGAWCALVGDKLFKVGDTLADGRRIAAITAAGVVLESN